MLTNYIAQQQHVSPDQVDQQVMLSYFMEQINKLPADQAKKKLNEYLVNKLKEEKKISDTEAEALVSKVSDKLDDFITTAKKGGDKFDLLIKLLALLFALYGLYKGGTLTTKGIKYLKNKSK